MTEHIPDGEGHFTLNVPPLTALGAPERPMYSFTWNGDVNSPILVAEGGYGERIIGEFEMPPHIYNSLVQVGLDSGHPATLAVVVMTAFETACIRWIRSNGGDSQ